MLIKNPHLPILFSLLISGCSIEENFQAKEAWQEFISVIETEYAYLDRLGSDYSDLKANFSAKINENITEQEFIDIAQQFTKSFRDPHLNVGPLNEKDYIVYPTGSDIYGN